LLRAVKRSVTELSSVAASCRAAVDVLMEVRRLQQPWGFIVAPILAQLTSRLGVFRRGSVCGHNDAICHCVPNAHSNECDQNAPITHHARLNRPCMMEEAPVQHAKPHPAKSTLLTVKGEPGA